MEKFSIVFQGLYDESNISSINNALKYTDDVILVLWKNNLSNATKSYLYSIGVKILELDDPGSIFAYSENGVSRLLNAKRVITALLEANKICKYQNIIKCRLDTFLQFDIFFEKWKNSNRRFASLNITTVSCNRFLSPNFYFHISDWVFSYNKKDLFNAEKYNSFVEDDFLLMIPRKYKYKIYFTRLTAEQIITLYFSCKLNSVDEYICVDFPSFKKFKKIHYDVLANYLNINRDLVGFRSSKYKALSTRWIMHDDQYFDDDYAFKLRPVQLLMYIIYYLRLIFSYKKLNT